MGTTGSALADTIHHEEALSSSAQNQSPGLHQVNERNRQDPRSSTGVSGPSSQRQRAQSAVSISSQQSGSKSATEIQGMVLGLPGSGKRTLLKRLQGKDPFNSSKHDGDSNINTIKVHVPYQQPTKNQQQPNQKQQSHPPRLVLQAEIPTASSLASQTTPPDFVVLLIHPQQDASKVHDFFSKVMILLKQQTMPMALCILLTFRDILPPTTETHQDHVQNNTDSQGETKNPKTEQTKQQISMEMIHKWIEPFQQSSTGAEKNGAAKRGKNDKNKSSPRITIETGETSLKNCFGLATLHYFVYQSHLQRQQFMLEQQLAHIHQEQLQLDKLAHPTTAPQSYADFVANLEKDELLARNRKSRKRQQQQLQKLGKQAISNSTQPSPSHQYHETQSDAPRSSQSKQNLSSSSKTSATKTRKPNLQVQTPKNSERDGSTAITGRKITQQNPNSSSRRSLIRLRSDVDAKQVLDDFFADDDSESLQQDTAPSARRSDYQNLSESSSDDGEDDDDDAFFFDEGGKRIGQGGSKKLKAKLADTSSFMRPIQQQTITKPKAKKTLSTPTKTKSNSVPKTKQIKKEAKEPSQKSKQAVSTSRTQESKHEVTTSLPDGASTIKSQATESKKPPIDTSSNDTSAVKSSLPKAKKAEKQIKTELTLPEPTTPPPLSEAPQKQQLQHQETKAEGNEPPQEPPKTDNLNGGEKPEEHNTRIPSPVEQDDGWDDDDLDDLIDEEDSSKKDEDQSGDVDNKLMSTEASASASNKEDQKKTLDRKTSNLSCDDQEFSKDHGKVDDDEDDDDEYIIQSPSHNNDDSDEDDNFMIEEPRVDEKETPLLEPSPSEEPTPKTAEPSPAGLSAAALAAIADAQKQMEATMNPVALSADEDGKKKKKKESKKEKKKKDKEKKEKKKKKV